MDISQGGPDRLAADDDSSPAPWRPRWGWLEVAAVFVLGVVPAWILQAFAQGESGAVRTSLIAVSLAYQALVWVVLGVAVVRLRGDRPGRIGWQVRRPGAAFISGLAGIFATIATVLAAGYIMLAALSLFMSTHEASQLLTAEEALQRDLLPTGPLGAGGVAALVVFAWLVPIGEEAMFRGLLQTELRDRFGVTAAVIVGSVVFALLHQKLGLHRLAFFSVGVVLALLRERTDSLLPPIIAHAGLNTATILLWRLHW